MHSSRRCSVFRQRTDAQRWVHLAKKWATLAVHMAQCTVVLELAKHQEKDEPLLGPDTGKEKRKGKPMTTAMSAPQRRARLPRNIEVQVIPRRIRTPHWPPVLDVKFTMRLGDAAEINRLEVGIDGDIVCSCEDFTDRKSCGHVEKIQIWLDRELARQWETEGGQILLAHKFLHLWDPDDE